MRERFGFYQRDLVVVAGYYYGLCIRNMFRSTDARVNTRTKHQPIRNTFKKLFMLHKIFLLNLVYDIYTHAQAHARTQAYTMESQNGWMALRVENKACLHLPSTPAIHAMAC